MVNVMRGLRTLFYYRHHEVFASCVLAPQCACQRCSQPRTTALSRALLAGLRLFAWQSVTSAKLIRSITTVIYKMRDRPA